MTIEIVQLDGCRTGPRRIAERVSAERARVESFNRHMIMALMPHRTAMWQGITEGSEDVMAIYAGRYA